MGFEKLMNPVLLGVVLAANELLIDFRIGSHLRDRRNRFRILHEASCQRFDLGRKCGTEEAGLSLRRSVLKDIRDVIDEAHIEHSIRLIENHVFDPPEADLPTFEKVENPARCANHHLGSPAQLDQLLGSMDSTHDERDANPHCFSEKRRHFLDLLGQLTGGAENQGLNAHAFRVELSHDGRGEGERFSGAGFRFADQVLTLQGNGNRQFLNRSRIDKSLLQQAITDFRREGEVAEADLFTLRLIGVFSRVVLRIGIRLIQAG